MRVKRCIAIAITATALLLAFINLAINPILESYADEEPQATKNESATISQEEFTEEEVEYIQHIQSQPPETGIKEYLGQFKLTAYCPCTACSGPWGSQTKSQTTAQEGYTIAVDPDIIPLGSKVNINGKTYMAEDIGGSVKGKTIDIYFDSHEEVQAFGKQHAEVYIEE